jgi:hypothetical protein
LKTSEIKRVSDYLKDELDSNRNLVHFNTFNKVVKRDIEFTILGDASTVSGSAIDLTSKTSAKITFRLPSKTGIITGEIEGAQKDQDIAIVTSGKFTGEVTGKMNFHLIPPINDYGVQNGSPEALRYISADIKKKMSEIMIDSVQILGLIVLEMFATEKEYDQYVSIPYVKILEADSKLNRHYKTDEYGSAAKIVLRPYLPISQFNFKLAIDIAKKYLTETNFDSITSMSEFRATVTKECVTEEKKLFDDFRKLLSRLGKRDELTIDEEIKYASPYWTAKQLTWLTISPGITYKTYSLFGIGNDGKRLVDETMPFFTPKVALWLSHYNIFQDKATLIRGGVEVAYGNNLKEFDEVKFHTRDTLQIEDKGDVIVKEKITDGLFRRQDSQQKYKFFFNAFIEYYLLPKKDFVPGFFVRGSYIKDGILEKNIRKLRPDIGLVLNLYNKEKKTTYLTVQPYLRYDNLLREAKLVNDQAVTVPIKDKWGYGLLVGLPIRGRIFTSED